jgi:hypothetical protein
MLALATAADVSFCDPQAAMRQWKQSDCNDEGGAIVVEFLSQEQPPHQS